jgi:nucleoside-diphosphate-sugar epimerase
MKIFVTGASGYIGRAVTEKLKAAGHAVAGLARSGEAAQKLKNLGAEAVRGDLRDSAAVQSAAQNSDGAIHLAMEMSAEAPALDRNAIDGILAGLGSSGKPFVYTSGVWVMGSTGGHTVDENTPVNPTPLVAWRPAHERLVLTAAGVRGVVIRPAMVYGRGGGIVGSWAGDAKKGAVRFVGTGENRWPFVHVDDLADLYRCILRPTGHPFRSGKSRRGRLAVRRFSRYRSKKLARTWVRWRTRWFSISWFRDVKPGRNWGGRPRAAPSWRN